MSKSLSGNSNVDLIVNNLSFQEITATNLTASSQITTVNAVISGAITNTELQNATSGVATNTSAIASNTNNIASNTSNIATNTSNIASNTSNIATNTSNIASNTSAIATNTSNIATNASNIATNTSNLTTKQDIITPGDGLSFAGTTLNAEVTQAELDAKQDILTFNAPGSNNSNPSTSAQIQTGLDGKQDTLTAGEGIDIANLFSTITFDGSALTTNILTTGQITGNNLKYVDTGGETNDVETKFSSLITSIASKQDSLTQGVGITINPVGNTISFSGGDLGSISLTTTGIVTAANLTGISYMSGTTSIDNNLTTTKGVTSKVMIFNDTGTNFDSSITNTGEFGEDAYFDDFASGGFQHLVGNDFGSMSSGVFTFSNAGTYKVEVQITAVVDSAAYPNNQRRSFGIYISKNDETASRVPFEMSGSDAAYRKGSIGVFYLRDDTDGVGGSAFLSQYLEFSADDTLRLKTLIDDSDGNAQFEDTLANDTLNISLCWTITLISDLAILNES